LINFYLNGRHQRVYIDNIKANAVKNWVLQGSILGPLFFLFNTDLPKAAGLIMTGKSGTGSKGWISGNIPL
jgi:hypothetical protein